MPNASLRTLAGALAIACVPAFAGTVMVEEGTPLRPTGKGWGEVDQEVINKDPSVRPSDRASTRTTKTANGITYHGGPLMLGTTNVYFVWYGNWGTDTAPTILTDLVRNAGNSPYYNINTTYSDASGHKVANALAHAGTVNVGATLGTSLSDAQIFSLVSGAIGSHALPLDANGIYVVMTAPDVTASSGFCTQYCGWHSYGKVGTTSVKFAFVGNPAQKCPSSCGARSPSPNGNPGADAMASVLMHEISEAVTDPVFTGYYDSRGLENADKCAWSYGTTYKTSNGAYANMSFPSASGGKRDFLIQQNWVNASGGYCATKY